MLVVLFAQQMTLAAGGANVEKRTFTFPKDFSIGTLFLVSHDEHRCSTGDEQPLTPAYGTVTVSVPKNKWLMLELNRKGFENPKCLDSIAAEGLDVLHISFMSMEDSENTLCDRALIHANHLKSLKCLLLDKSDTSDKSIMQLNGLPNIVYISATMSSVNGDCFKTFTKFPKLRTLLLYDDPLKPESFRYLPLSPNLSYLDLHSTQLDDNAMKYLGQCPNISLLRIETNPKVTDAGLKYLLNLKHLESLDLSGTRVTCAGLKTLAGLKLKHLFVSQGVYSEKELASLKEVCPDVIVVGKARRLDQGTKDMYAPLH